jgi:hypothetical protein
MKIFAVLLFCLGFTAPAVCISVEDLGRLAQLKTADDLILEIIYEEGVDHPIDAKDVIYLKEHGLSEKIISYLWKQSFQDREFLPPQEGESMLIGENLRSYSSTDKFGKKIMVLTNLDEEGRRMGPPPPPAPERHYEPESTYVMQPLQENSYPVQSQSPAWAQMQTIQPSPFTVPIYNSGYAPFFPIFSSYPSPIFNRHCKPIWGKYGVNGQYRVNVHAPVIWPGMKGSKH